MKFTPSEIRMLNDIWCGVQCDYDELIFIYKQCMNKGVVPIDVIRQFAGRGIPIFKYLSKILECSVEQVKNKSFLCEINSDHIKDSLKLMTSKGELFYRLFDIQYKTLSGDYWIDKINDLDPKDKYQLEDMLNVVIGSMTLDLFKQKYQ